MSVPMGGSFDQFPKRAASNGGLLCVIAALVLAVLLGIALVPKATGDVAIRLYGVLALDDGAGSGPGVREIWLLACSPSVVSFVEVSACKTMSRVGSRISLGLDMIRNPQSPPSAAALANWYVFKRLMINRADIADTRLLLALALYRSLCVVAFVGFGLVVIIRLLWKQEKARPARFERAPLQQSVAPFCRIKFAAPVALAAVLLSQLLLALASTEVPVYLGRNDDILYLRPQKYLDAEFTGAALFCWAPLVFSGVVMSSVSSGSWRRGKAPIRNE